MRPPHPPEAPLSRLGSESWAQAPAPETLERFAVVSARRARERNAMFRREPEAPLAARFIQLFETIFSYLETGSLASLERHLDSIIRLRARQGFAPEDVFVGLEEAETALAELVVDEDGLDALSGARWRGIRTALRHAERYVLRGITEFVEQMSEADASSFRTLLESIPHLIILLDEQHIIQYVNGRVVEIFGVHPADVVGLPIAEALGPRVLKQFADPGAAMQSLHTTLSRPDEASHVVHRFKDGRQFISRSYPVRQGERRGRVYLVEEMAGPAAADLSVAELTVLRLLAEGLDTAAIAERLALPEPLADEQVSATLRALGARSRIEAVAKGRGAGLVY